MMTHELALKLKEAGFPQPLITERYCKFSGYLEEEGVKVYSPSLSELIEAIFESYSNISFEMGGMNTWWAVGREKNRRAIVPVQIGNTPEEAVALLWLALNKK